MNATRVSKEESLLNAAALLGTTRVCVECGKKKPLSMFNRDMRHRESFLKKCRSCQFKRYADNEDEG